MFKLIRKIFVIVLLALLVATLSSRAEAGLIKNSLKFGNDVVKTVKRLLPNGIEKQILRSGYQINFKGTSVFKRNQTFDPDALDAMGRSNRDRMVRGFAPIGKDGVPVHLHHHQQRNKGPVVEMTATEHRQLNKALHNYTRNSEIDRSSFNKWKQEYWRDRAHDFTS
jgi:hypothetical protein